MIKGFFFDLDGTLVDTHESNFFAYKDAAQVIKAVCLEDELMLFIKSGENSNSFLRKLIPEINDDEVIAINKLKGELYPTHLSKSRINADLVDFLGRISDSHQTVLVTTAKKRNAISVLEYYNLSGYFSHKIFGEDVDNMKPDPQAYDLALKKTGLKPEEVIAFEDSDNGIAAARAAGIATIRVRDFL